MATKKWNIMKDKNVLKATMENYSLKSMMGMVKPMKQFSHKVTRTAQKNAPSTTGALRASLHPYYETSGTHEKPIIRAGVFSNKTYARTQEKGMSPRNVSVKNLEIWSRMKGAKNPYAHAKSVHRTIRQKGVVGKKFMEKALDLHKSWLKREIEKVLGSNFK